MATFFASQAFNMYEVTFGNKVPNGDFGYDPQTFEPADYLPIFYSFHDLIPRDYVDTFGTLTANYFAHYEIISAYSSSTIMFSQESATSGTFSVFGLRDFSSPEGEALFKWIIMGVAVSAIDLDATVSSSDTQDDSGLFSSLFELNDKIFLSEASDAFGSGSGNDLLYGFGGDDNLGGGVGSDTIIGGAGNDYLSGGDSNFYYSPEGELLPTEVSGSNVVDGGDGDDVVLGGHGADTLGHLDF
jgi:hypothetical protein